VDYARFKIEMQRWLPFLVAISSQEPAVARPWKLSTNISME
jgi:hypothetical protein